MSGYILYYDSGTSNTRAYLLDRDFQVQYTAKTAVGSKASAISGSNAVLIQGMRALYDRVLSANGLKEEDITALYASGMITSPYGLKEVPHLVLPLTVKELAEKLGCRFIDVNDGLRDENGRLKKEYTIEGIHMYANGYRVVLENLRKYL